MLGGGNRKRYLGRWDLQPIGLLSCSHHHLEKCSDSYFHHTRSKPTPPVKPGWVIDMPPFGPLESNELGVLSDVLAA